jgi:LPXTG-site transpeptidase (sortase) family protein
LLVRFSGWAAGRSGLLVLGATMSLTLTACFGQSTPATPTAGPQAGTSPTTGAVAAPTTSLPTIAPARPSPAASPSPSPSPAAVTVYWPEEIEIPKISVKAQVVHIGLDSDGAMEAPNGPDIIGWYTGSVAPGIDGNTLVTAHVDWLDRQTGTSREAVFWNLHKLEKGDRIIVRSEENKSFTFAVKDSITVRFDDQDALKYLDPTDNAILTLITCEGDFDANTRNYDLRRIVVAERQ